MTSQEEERELGRWVGGKVVKGSKKGSSVRAWEATMDLNTKWTE